MRARIERFVVHMHTQTQIHACTPNACIHTKLHHACTLSVALSHTHNNRHTPTQEQRHTPVHVERRGNYHCMISSRQVEGGQIISAGYVASGAPSLVMALAHDGLDQATAQLLLEQALLQREGNLPAPPEDPMSADRVRWEHIQRVFEQCDRNVSETARRLKMHRRTLQRILAKHAPRS